MYNMDNQNVMNNLYQQQQSQYAQFNQQQQQQSFNQSQNPSFYSQTPALSSFVNAQTFVPQANVANPMYSSNPTHTLPQQNIAPTNSYMYNPNNISNEANLLKEKLQRRLAKDIEEFQNQLSNFPNFNAIPLKDKLEEWHFNVWPQRGVYIDYIINGVIQFPTEYPQKPPSIELSVPIPHPNVKCVSSKAWVELDILSATKWKQSYSILDIFRELSKVFSLTERSELGDNVSDDEIRIAHQKLKSFKCMWTGHTSLNPVPRQGQPIPHSKKQINQLHAALPLTIENHAYQWRYCRIKQVECSFGKVYYEARVVSSVLGPNNLTTIQIGWALPPDDDPALGEEFEYVVLGNRYYAHSIGGVIIHKQPFQISHNNIIETGFGEQNDKIACSADFETTQISFYINGRMVGVMKFPDSFIESDKPLVPVIGLSLASVELNFKNLQCEISDLSQSYLTIQEYLQIDRSDWVWERGSLVDWNVLFTYGLPMDVGNGNGNSNGNDNEATQKGTDDGEAHKFRLLVLEIFHCLGFSTLRSCREVCKIWNVVINRAYFVHRSRLKCYYCDKSFDVSHTKIGLMLNLKLSALDENDNNNNENKNRRNKGNRGKQAVAMSSTHSLELISSSTDCISFNVWDKLNIHIDSSHEDFTHFLPLIINEAHARRISKLLTKQIASITERAGFRAERLLFVLSSLLNSVIVGLHRELFIAHHTHTRHALITDSLSLWCHLHHILLYLCTKFPAMQSAADSRIRELFINKRDHKLSSIPDLGILIMYLLISGQYTWHTIRRLWVEESLSRDCKKLFAQNENVNLLNKLDSDALPDEERLQIMYSATAESRSLTRLLIAFNVITMNHTNNSNNKTNQKETKLTIEEQLKEYNLRFGSPAAHWMSSLEDKLEEIECATQWTQYFTGIFVVAPPTKVLSSLLFRCFIQGAQSGYYKIQSSITPMEKAPQQQQQQQQQMNNNNNNDNRDNRDNRDSRDSRDRRGRMDNRRDNRDNMRRDNRDNRRDNMNQRDNNRRDNNVNQRENRRDNRRDNNRDNMRDNRNRFNNAAAAPPERVKGDRFGSFRDRERRPLYGERDNRDSRDNRDNRGGRGRGRGGGGRGRGGGRGGRRSDDYHDPNFNPNKQISKYTGFQHRQIAAINQFKQFPDWIREGATRDADIKTLNEVQKVIMADLCLGNDSVIVSSPGCGKSTAIILSAFYRLYTKKAPAHVLFIAVDHIHVEMLRHWCSKLGSTVPDLNVIAQIRGSRYVSNRQLTEGRNIFICSPGKAINLCENGKPELQENLVSVSVFDGDTLLVTPLFTKLKNTFKWIPTNINVNFIATSYCAEMEKNIKQLIDFDSGNTKKHFLNHENYDNLKFWFVFCPDRSLRVPMLNELCKVNPYRQGIVFCAGPHQAKVVQDSLKSLMDTHFKSCILESESMNETNACITQYNNGSIQYIIAHEYSPIHMLYKIHPQNLKIIINFEIRSSSAYLKRANICKYQSAAHKVHVISLIDNDQTKIYEDVEQNCKVQLDELPSNVAEVLVDEDKKAATAAAAKNNNKNDKE